MLEDAVRSAPGLDFKITAVVRLHYDEIGKVWVLVLEVLNVIFINTCGAPG